MVSRLAIAFRMRPVALVTAGAVATICIAAATWADLSSRKITPVGVGLDLAVGIGFLCLWALSRDGLAIRSAWFGVGALWLAASAVRSLSTAHQGALLVGLVLCAGCWSAAIWCSVAAGSVIAVGIVPQWAAGGLFVLAAGTVLLKARDRCSLVVGGVATSVGGVLLAEAWISRSDATQFDPELALDAYAAVLLASATALVVEVRTRGAAATSLSAEGQDTGIAGLQRVLAATLRDPGLQLLRGVAIDDGDIAVAENGRPVAAIRPSRSLVLDDRTRTEVVNAVRLSMQGEELADRLRAELTEMDAARSRLADAVQRQRELMSDRLSNLVLPHLRTARALLSEVESAHGVPEAATAVEDTMSEIDAIVAGIHEQRFLGERLSDALRDLAGRSGVRVEVEVDEMVVPPAIALALYLTAAEALTNASKHSGATVVRLQLQRSPDDASLTVADDGRGGADPNAPGLQGVRERISRLGGRFIVDSAVGRGTTVVATLPVRAVTRSSSTP